MESDWRYGAWRVGWSGPLGILGIPASRIEFAAQLNTPIVLFGFEYDVLGLEIGPFGRNLLAGFQLLSGYVTSWQPIGFSVPNGFPFGYDVAPDTPP